MEQTYKIGTRTSPLALRQVEEVMESLRGFYPSMRAEIVGLDTYGDKNKTIPISQIEGSDFFTREIDEALLIGKIDFAVHSAKDLPDNLLYRKLNSFRYNCRGSGRLQAIPQGVTAQKMRAGEHFWSTRGALAPMDKIRQERKRVPILREGLVIAALTKSIDPYDVLVSKSGLKLNELTFGAKIGTSSLRRKKQLMKFREDFQIVDIRGNIEERLKLLDDNEPLITNHEPPCLDGIVIAAAGLLRLRLEYRITQRIPFDILRPHPLQGSLALITRAEDLNLIRLMSLLDSREVISV